jgi:hypothetical protein
VIRSAARQGRDPAQLLQDVVEQYLEEDARFVEEVTLGEDASKRGDFLTHEVERCFERFLE